MPQDQHWSMQPSIRLAQQLAKRDLPILVYDAVNLEGVAMTLPEVQTLLEGITVGGHKISDQNMTLNQTWTWKYLFDLVNKGAFAFNKAIALQLHAITEQDEALEWGKFRSGYVTIAGSNYEPPLDKRWLEVEQMMLAKADVYDQAITAFLQMVRAQFF